MLSLNSLATNLRVEWICCIVGVAVVVGIFILTIVKTYVKECPHNKLLVVFAKNKDGTFRTVKCMHGGVCFVKPVVQMCSFLDLTPMPIAVELKNAPTKQHICVNVSSTFTIAVSTDHTVMLAAADKLVGRSQQDISDFAQNIIFGQLLLIISTMDLNDIENDPEGFVNNVSLQINGELNKVGLKLLQMVLTDISVDIAV
jgi:flotillin